MHTHIWKCFCKCAFIYGTASVNVRECAFIESCNIWVHRLAPKYAWIIISEIIKLIKRQRGISHSKGRENMGKKNWLQGKKGMLVSYVDQPWVMSRLRSNPNACYIIFLMTYNYIFGIKRVSIVNLRHRALWSLTLL